MINVYEAKTQLSKLLDRAAGGEEIVLGKSGKPLARLVPYVEKRSPRRPGRLAGKIKMAEDFDEHHVATEIVRKGRQDRL